MVQAVIGEMAEVLGISQEAYEALKRKYALRDRKQIAELQKELSTYTPGIEAEFLYSVWKLRTKNKDDLVEFFNADLHLKQILIDDGGTEEEIDTFAGKFITHLIQEDKIWQGTKKVLKG